jgi:hypothetical protein
LRIFMGAILALPFKKMVRLHCGACMIQTKRHPKVAFDVSVSAVMGPAA